MLNENFGKPIELESKIKTTRIIFCVVLVVPTWIFLYFLSNFDADTLSVFIHGFAMVFLSLVLTVIGTITIFRARSYRRPQKFWYFVSAIAAVPLVYSLGVAILHIVLR